MALQENDMGRSVDAPAFAAALEGAHHSQGDGVQSSAVCHDVVYGPALDGQRNVGAGFRDHDADRGCGAQFHLRHIRVILVCKDDIRMTSP